MVPSVRLRGVALRSIKFIGATTASILVLGSLGATEAVGTPIEDDLAELVTSVAPNQDLVIDAGSDLVAVGTLGTVDIPDDVTEAMVLTRYEDGAQVGILLPSEANLGGVTSVGPDGVEYADAGTDDVEVVVQPLADGSVQISTVIPSPDAPHSFTYEMTVPEGTTLSVETSGEVVAMSPTGEFVAGFAAPWAFDVNGDSVETWYEIDGVDVVQVVAPSANTAYPVVADPWLGIALIDDVTKSWYSGQGWRFYVYPSVWGRVGAGVAARTAAWNEAKSYYSGMNTGGLADQFYCHFDGRLVTFAKGSWNLESWRPDVSYAATVAAGCNP
jgi:hypothetical protein